MKTQKILIRVFAMFLAGFSILQIGCDKFEVSDVVTYKGQVVHKGTSTPFPNLEVKLTDGNNVNTASKTDEEGLFSINVNISTINGNYYFLVGDATCVPKKVEIPAFGIKECDLGIIEVEGPSLPIVRTKPMTDITAESAVGGGFVDEDGRLEVTARGICYSQSEYPTIEDAHTQDGLGKGEFTSSLKNLEHKVTYYARAYATNKEGTSYGEQVKFITEAGVPIVTTDTIINITAHTAKCKAHVESDGGYPVVKRGICYSKQPDPTIDDDITEDGSGLGAYTSSLKNLVKNTTYYVRAYATNSTGTTYGEQLVFTTLDGLAVVSTDSVTGVTATGCVVYGTIIADCDIPVTARGFCYAKTQYPTIEEMHTTIGDGLGIFQSTISNLEYGTTYYIRAYATNATGTTYGKQIVIMTTNGLPEVTTILPREIRSNKAKCGGNITSDGGFTLTSCGVCWSSSTASPKITDSKIEVVAKLGEFFVDIISLEVNTTYYVRAYASNENGISYGETMSFTTANGLPIVETTDPGENITSTSIATGGNVTDDGGSTVTARGVVYSTLPYPTLENASKVASGSGIGYFSANITNISPINNTYYIRAYATNSNGTAYGAQITITPERSEYLSLPTIIYGGYKYHVYKDMGKGDWYTATQLCEDLTFAGYSDWYLPDEYELVAMIQAKIDGWYIEPYSSPYFSIYWTSSRYSSSYIYHYKVYGPAGYGECNGSYYRDKSGTSGIYRFRAVRKDKIQ